MGIRANPNPSATPINPIGGVSTFTESRDRARGLYRLDWMRPRVTGGMRNYTEIFSNEVGNRMGVYVTGIDVNLGQTARAVGPADKPLHTNVRDEADR
jgi:hypothetical protein